MTKRVRTPGPEISEAWIEEYESLTAMGCSKWEMIRAMRLTEDAFDKRVSRMNQMLQARRRRRQTSPDPSALQLPNPCQSGVNL